MNSKYKVMSLGEKVRRIHEFELIPDIQERNNLRKSDPLVDALITNRRKIIRQYSIMQTKLAAVKTVAVGFSGPKYEAEKQSLLERVMIEWYQRAEILLKPKQISESMFQERVKMATTILNIASLPASFSYENFFRRCCFLAKRNDIKTYSYKSTSLRAIIKELIIQDGISKEYALNIFGIDITEDEEGAQLGKEEVPKPEKLSLKEKVNIIHNFGLMKKNEQVSLKSNNAEISNIIENKSKILVQYNTMNAKLAVVESQIESINVNKKFDLLLEIMVEWYLRADENPGAKGATVSMIELREKSYTAFKMFGFTSLPSSLHWLNILWKSCQAAKNKAVHEKKLSSLGLKDIARYVLKREGISNKIALTYFGINISGEPEKNACKVRRIGNQQDVSTDKNEDGIEIRMNGTDDFDDATHSTASIVQSNLNESTISDQDQDEGETFELYDIISTGSSDGFDATTSTEDINYNEEFETADDVDAHGSEKEEGSLVSSTNPYTTLKAEDYESETVQDLSADTFIRPSVHDWLIENGYEIEDVQPSNLDKHEAISISPLKPSNQFEFEGEESCDERDDLCDEKNESIEMCTEDMIKSDMAADPKSAVIKVNVNESNTAEVSLTDTSIRESVRYWLTNNEYDDTIDDIRQEKSNEDSIILPLKTSDRMNEFCNMETNNDRTSNPNEDGESIEMVIFVDEDGTEAIGQGVMDDSRSETVINVTNESQSSED